MDNASEFLRMLQNDRSLSGAHRPIRLRLGHADHPLATILLPQRVTGSEAICGGLEYTVTCVASTPRLPLKELIALPAEIGPSPIVADCAACAASWPKHAPAISTVAWACTSW